MQDKRKCAVEASAQDALARRSHTQIRRTHDLTRSHIRETHITGGAHPAGVLGYGTGLPSGGSDTPNGWARVFLPRRVRLAESHAYNRGPVHTSARPILTHLCEIAKIATLRLSQAAIFAAPPHDTLLALAPACVGYGPTSAQPTPVHTRRARRPANGDFSPNGEKWRLGDRGKRSPAARHRPPRCLRLSRGA